MMNATQAPLTARQSMIAQDVAFQVERADDGGVVGLPDGTDVEVSYNPDGSGIFIIGDLVISFTDGNKGGLAVRIAEQAVRNQAAVSLQ